MEEFRMLRTRLNHMKEPAADSFGCVVTQRFSGGGASR